MCHKSEKSMCVYIYILNIIGKIVAWISCVKSAFFLNVAKSFVYLLWGEVGGGGMVWRGSRSGGGWDQWNSPLPDSESSCWALILWQLKGFHRIK